MTPHEPAKKIITPQAQRALDEAQARREASEAEAMRQIEEGGPKGLEPTRYGDWESKGMCVDF